MVSSPLLTKTDETNTKCQYFNVERGERIKDQAREAIHSPLLRIMGDPARKIPSYCQT